MRRRPGMRSRKLRDRLGLDPALSGEPLLDATSDGSQGVEVVDDAVPGLGPTEAESWERTATAAQVRVDGLTMRVSCQDASVLDDRVYVALTRLPIGVRSQDGNSWTFPRIMVEATVRDLAARYRWPWYDADARETSRPLAVGSTGRSPAQRRCVRSRCARLHRQRAHNPSS